MNTVTIRSIQIHPTDTITTLNLASDSIGTDICGAIGCSMFDVVGLQDDIDLFVDDVGLINGSTLNLPATVLAHRLGRPTVVFGTAIAVSVTRDGETVGLTDTQYAQIQQALAQKPDAGTVDALVESLSPFPTVVSMLRNI
ncbi:DUF3846 domain-containing protein [Cryobacterium algoritolerans]|uniref:DUF3846 domain-containing protein n=1 Tax=Cryobacterium algoritolerans TaxID=1259184 RepID=A0A4R8WVX4_9MICO|nr:DUF3846 domain-containing protein [Cryobacterium algoritolerans]TFC17463.1 DUF3846 domain-containing protein [Cryobacterium algoritolerans]